MEGLNRISGDIPWTEPDITQMWAEYIADNKSWIEKMGGNIHLFAVGGEHPEVPGSESIQLWHYNGAVTRMMKSLYEQVSQRGAEVRHNAAAKKLLTNINGDVVGVRVETGEGHRMDIGANRGVILACGGFEFDERMKLNYLKTYPAYFYGSPANTDDGIRMALEVGADLWHMNCCSARAVGKFAEYPWSFPLDFGGKGWTARLLKSEGNPEPAGYILVNRYGKRFTSENFKLHCLYYELGLFDTQRLEYPRIPCYWIFNQSRIEAGALPLTIAGPAGPQQLYHWSQENSKELESDWIISGATVEELALKLDIPPDALRTTVNTYNGYCEKGHDPEFKRRPLDLIPLERPPFYAVRLWPGGANTRVDPVATPTARYSIPMVTPYPDSTGPVSWARSTTCFIPREAAIWPNASPLGA